ncbi:hypothetical protein UFOVP1229_169 [uncultured Caudovirales phage]|uniref:Uncharacterized protein n=1 Tax=uncultured Caudovirales phage TaxID=2100421 RepID=A0A6J5RBB5_9CAUD|nr:hypothetical protein UFOVP1229_169 [uncultured Caudovirales phage]
MFNLTTIQLRNVREKAQSLASKIIPERYVPMKAVIDALKIVAVDLGESPIETLDIWSKQ